MPKLAAKHNAADDYRRALRLLADGPDGHTEAIMRAPCVMRAPEITRDVKAIAIEAAEYLKQKNPNVEVTVRDRESGETIIIKPQPPKLK